jgi:hypothetical protein
MTLIAHPRPQCNVRHYHPPTHPLLRRYQSAPNGAVGNSLWIRRYWSRVLNALRSRQEPHACSRRRSVGTRRRVAASSCIARCVRFTAHASNRWRQIRAGTNAHSSTGLLRRCPGQLSTASNGGCQGVGDISRMLRRDDLAPWPRRPRQARLSSRRNDDRTSTNLDNRRVR